MLYNGLPKHCALFLPGQGGDFLKLGEDPRIYRIVFEAADDAEQEASIGDSDRHEARGYKCKDDLGRIIAV